MPDRLKTRTSELGPLLKAMPNSLPPPTPQQNFCRRWNTSIWVALSSHREEQPQWGSVTVTVCWSNIWSPTPAFLSDPGISAAGPQRGLGSRCYLVLHAGRQHNLGHTAPGCPEPRARHAIICAVLLEYFILTCLACPRPSSLCG